MAKRAKQERKECVGIRLDARTQGDGSGCGGAAAAGESLIRNIVADCCQTPRSDERLPGGVTRRRLIWAVFGKSVAPSKQRYGRDVKTQWRPLGR